jgi:hypothetical protein
MSFEGDLPQLEHFGLGALSAIMGGGTRAARDAIRSKGFVRVKLVTCIEMSPKKMTAVFF